jgi:CTP:molybdopterin cytidylyltransferase MocA
MISAILLAAGRSQRMGAFKPLLPFGDKTVIEACIDNLAAGGVGEIVVVLGHRGDELRNHLANHSVRFVLNTEPESEMGVSIALGVDQISKEAEAVFIALVDQPAVPPEVIRFLSEERERTGARLIIPQYEERGGHPVLIDLCFRNELSELDPRIGLRGIFETHKASVRRVSVASPFVVRDMDTWDDYRALHVEIFASEP